MSDAVDFERLEAIDDARAKGYNQGYDDGQADLEDKIRKILHNRSMMKETKLRRIAEIIPFAT